MTHPLRGNQAVDLDSYGTVYIYDEGDGPPEAVHCYHPGQEIPGEPGDARRYHGRHTPEAEWTHGVRR